MVGRGISEEGAGLHTGCKGRGKTNKATNKQTTMKSSDLHPGVTLISRVCSSAFWDLVTSLTAASDGSIDLIVTPVPSSAPLTAAPRWRLHVSIKKKQPKTKNHAGVFTANKDTCVSCCRQNLQLWEFCSAAASPPSIPPSIPPLLCSPPSFSLSPSAHICSLNLLLSV